MSPYAVDAGKERYAHHLQPTPALVISSGHGDRGAGFWEQGIGVDEPLVQGAMMSGFCSASLLSRRRCHIKRYLC